MYGAGIALFKDVIGIPGQPQGLVVDIIHNTSFVSGQPVSIRSNDDTTYMLLRVGMLNFHTLYLYTIDPEPRDDGTYNVVGITEFPATNMSAPKTKDAMERYMKRLGEKKRVAVT